MSINVSRDLHSYTVMHNSITVFFFFKMSAVLARIKVEKMKW